DGRSLPFGPAPELRAARGRTNGTGSGRRPHLYDVHSEISIPDRHVVAPGGVMPSDEPVDRATGSRSNSAGAAVAPAHLWLCRRSPPEAARSASVDQIGKLIQRRAWLM